MSNSGRILKKVGHGRVKKKKKKKRRSLGGSSPPRGLEEAMVWVGSKPELLEGRQD